MSNKFLLITATGRKKQLMEHTFELTCSFDSLHPLLFRSTINEKELTIRQQLYDVRLRQSQWRTDDTIIARNPKIARNVA